MRMARRTWDFSVRREQVEGAMVVSLKGRLGSLAVHLLGDLLDGPADIAVVVDLAELDYISGLGLAALTAAANRAAADQRILLFCGLREAVATCFDLAGLLPDMAVEPDRHAAIARITTRQAG